jgi:hypothetical protein
MRPWVQSLRAGRRHDWPGAVMENEYAEPIKSGAESSPPAQPDEEKQTSARSLSAVQVTEVVRDVIRQLAPEELPVFDSVANAWLADSRRRQRSGKSPGATVGFGVETLLLTQLAFPIITGALGAVLGDVAEDRVRVRRLIKRRAAEAGGKPAGADTGKTSESPARDVLTSQQAQAVGDACERHARTLGMSSAKAKLLADAVLGSLTPTRGGD